jgi:tetratricopeptide (TPR) repeat protein
MVGHLALLTAVLAVFVGVASQAQPQGDSRESKDMFISRGDASFAQGKYEQAIANYARAIELSKRNAGEVMGGDYGSRTRTFDLAPIYEKLGAAYSALAAKSREVK